MKLLIYGARGWIGQQFCALLKDTEYISAQSRADNIKDVENAVIYLCSDMSSMVTGTSLMVDGGWTAQ